MIFPAATFLYLLPLAGLPVLFHLVLKQKKRKVVFSTLMFFHRTDPKLNSHRKIREWLLLAMRVLLIAFLLLALSRPAFVTSANLRGRIAVVAIVDNSGSMGGLSDNDRSKLDCAVEGARRLISELEGGSKAAVVPLVADPAVDAPDSLTADKESLLASIGRIRTTQATGDVREALSRAFKLLDTSPARGGIVHVFTDLQDAEWGASSAWSADAGATAGMTVCFHKIESKIRSEANVGIKAVQFPEERILPNHRYKVGLVLQNSSEGTADVRVNWIDNKGYKDSEAVTLGQGTVKTVEIEIKPDEAGCHWARAWIEDDGFSADNEAGIGMLCEETATVLFGGAREEFGVLPLALSPSGEGQFTGMVGQFLPPERLSGAAAGTRPILIVMTWKAIQSMVSTDWLRKYVEGGGNLLIVPSSVARRAPRAGQLPDWLGADIRALEAHRQGVSLQVLDKTAAFWHPIREATASRSLESVNACMFSPLQLSDKFVPLLGVNLQKVFMAQRSLGAGNIYVSGMALARRWSALPTTGLFVVLVQRMAIGGTSSGQQQTISLVAGEHPQGIRVEGGQVQITSLTGDSMDWRGREQEIPTFCRAGAYLLKTGDSEYCISVRASDKEGWQEFVKGSQVPAMSRILHQVHPYKKAEDFEQYHKYQARSVSLYLPLLLLLTLALLAEGLLGAPNPTAAKASAGEQRVPQVRADSGESTQQYKGQLASLAERLTRPVRGVIGRSSNGSAARRSAS